MEVILLVYKRFRNCRYYKQKIVFLIFSLASIVLLCVLPSGLVARSGEGGGYSTILIESYTLLGKYFASLADGNNDANAFFIHLFGIWPFYTLIASSILMYFDKYRVVIILMSIILVFAIVLLITYYFKLIYPGCYFWPVLLGIAIYCYIQEKRYPSEDC